MNVTDAPIDSYASPARRRGYVAAMRRIAASRQPGQPVRIYFSVPPEFIDRPNWEQRLDIVRGLLPASVELLYFRTEFDPAADYFEQWPKLAETLDGLVLTGLRRKPHRTREQRLGPVARNELISMVSTGKPVLLHSMDHGLVPVLDCQPERIGNEPHQRLKLTIPNGWSTEAPTLQAALAALCPAHGEEKPRLVEWPVHITRPFAASHG
ncbi:hypothetical protein ABZ746_23535 [Streptomyces sp. NPDC020096]